MDMVKMALDAVKGHRWLHGSYQAESRVGQLDGAIERSVLPFQVYRSKEGQLVIEGYDTYRNDVRTFRLDRFLDLELGDKFQGEKDPGVLYPRGGEVIVYPTAAKLFGARPQAVPARMVERFILAGWGLTPPDFIVDANVH